MKYRILITTQACGKKLFYPQQRSMLFFWLSTSPGFYVKGYDTLEQALTIIKEANENQKAKKIVKKEVYDCSLHVL